jgi:hypothetical protein
MNASRVVEVPIVASMESALRVSATVQSSAIADTAHGWAALPWRIVRIRDGAFPKGSAVLAATVDQILSKMRQVASWLRTTGAKTVSAPAGRSLAENPAADGRPGSICRFLALVGSLWVLTCGSCDWRSPVPCRGQSVCPAAVTVRLQLIGRRAHRAARHREQRLGLQEDPR